MNFTKVLVAEMGKGSRAEISGRAMIKSLSRVHWTCSPIRNCRRDGAAVISVHPLFGFYSVCEKIMGFNKNSSGHSQTRRMASRIASISDFVCPVLQVLPPCQLLSPIPDFRCPSHCNL